MANDETPAGFLSRWSRRKAEDRQGVALDDAGNNSNNQGKKLGENLNSELLGTDAVNSEKSWTPLTRPVGSPDQKGDQNHHLDSTTQQKPTPSMADHGGEKPGDENERMHPELMRPEKQKRHPVIRADVDHRSPVLRGYIHPGCMEDDAQKHRARPHRIE